jgi:hypothetical protein
VALGRQHAHEIEGLAPAVELQRGAAGRRQAEGGHILELCQPQQPKVVQQPHRLAGFRIHDVMSVQKPIGAIRQKRDLRPALHRRSVRDRQPRQHVMKSLGQALDLAVPLTMVFDGSNVNAASLVFATGLWGCVHFSQHTASAPPIRRVARGKAQAALGFPASRTDRQSVRRGFLAHRAA